MDKRKEANLRVKRNIVRALTELMQKKNYSDISVSEITALAGVSRISYYRNYDSKEDILTESLESLMTHFSEEINPLPLHTPGQAAAPPSPWARRRAKAGPQGRDRQGQPHLRPHAGRGPGGRHPSRRRHRCGGRHHSHACRGTVHR